MYVSFINTLPEKVRSAEFKDEGAKFRKREKALGYRYVELNQLYKKFIALDIDAPASAYLWDEHGLPQPSIVVVNPENTHCHRRAVKYGVFRLSITHNSDTNPRSQDNVVQLGQASPDNSVSWRRVMSPVKIAAA